MTAGPTVPTLADVYWLHMLESSRPCLSLDPEIKSGLIQATPVKPLGVGPVVSIISVLVQTRDPVKDARQVVLNARRPEPAPAPVSIAAENPTSWNRRAGAKEGQIRHSLVVSG